MNIRSWFRKQIYKFSTATAVACFALSFAVGEEVKLTYSVHPAYTHPIDMQALFNSGSELLKSDDDGPGDRDDADDVALEVSFTLTEAASRTFPNQSSPEFEGAEQYDFTLPRYNKLENDVVKLHLRDANFANIKLVESATRMTGRAKCTNNTMVLNGSKAKPSTAMHEWAHLAGIYGHRNGSTDFIMYATTNKNRREINSKEKTALEQYFQTGGMSCRVIDYTL